MSDVLCTAPGKLGDILWALATVREISRIHGKKVDFVTMPEYAPLGALLREQSYIDKAGVVLDWRKEHSNYGDQPWRPPREVEKGYWKTYHLGYRRPPGVPAPQPLIDYVAWQQHLLLREPVVPFITVPGHEKPEGRWAAVGFNEQHAEEKAEFCKELQGWTEGIEWVDVTKKPWVEAARAIQQAELFVGCRSSNWVLACGLGKETITFEPNVQRHGASQSGRLFGCPYAQETQIPGGLTAMEAAKVAAEAVWKKFGSAVACIQSP